MGSEGILPASVVKRDGSVVFVQVGEEFIALHAQLAECFSLNETAKQVWDMLGSPTQVDRICERLGEAYAVDPATCQWDVIELLESLRAAGLIEVGVVG